MAKKYELLEAGTKTVIGQPLYRIKALRNIPVYGVKVGDIGGFVTSEDNLAHDGEAWIADDAVVLGSAMVHGNALVCEDAQVYGSARVLDSALVRGSARVHGHARVYDEAQVSGSAHVYESAYVFGAANVFGESIVRGSVRISGGAQVFGDAVVDGKATLKLRACVGADDHYITVGPIGSMGGTLTAALGREGEIYINRGCFDGTLEEFKTAVRNKHAGTRFEREYNLIVELIEVRFSAVSNKE